RQVGLIEAIAVDVELPAVISAAESVILIAAEKHRRQAVREAMIHDADTAGRVAERDQLLTEQHQTHLRAVGLELRGQTGGNPELPHELAHWRVAADAREGFVFGFAGHLASPALFFIWPSGSSTMTPAFAIFRKEAGRGGPAGAAAGHGGCRRTL